MGFMGCNDSGFTVSDFTSAQQDLSHPDLPPAGDSSEPSEENVPSPVPSVVPTGGPVQPPVDNPHGNPKPKPSCNPGNGNGPITPAVIDALVTKYGCVDTSDEGKSSNEKKILVCHVPKGNPRAAHSICIAVPGAINGHGIDPKTCLSPVGDYCGACKPAAQ